MPFAQRRPADRRRSAQDARRKTGENVVLRRYARFRPTARSAATCTTTARSPRWSRSAGVRRARPHEASPRASPSTSPPACRRSPVCGHARGRVRRARRRERRIFESRRRERQAGEHRRRRWSTGASTSSSRRSRCSSSRGCAIDSKTIRNLVDEQGKACGADANDSPFRALPDGRGVGAHAVPPKARTRSPTAHPAQDLRRGTRRENGAWLRLSTRSSSSPTKFRRS